MSSDKYFFLEGVGKILGGKEVLKDISLELKQGEIFGLVGPDGSGKSTLLKIMAGVWSANQGRLGFGSETFQRTPKHLRANIGYMAFDEGLYEELTALENLRYAAWLYPTPHSSERIEHLLKVTELKAFKNLPVKYFSGGMKQKLSLCCALLHRPSLLLLDEPSTGIDPHSRRIFWELLFDIPDEGTTLVITTPYFDEIERCERVALLSEGKMIWNGVPREFQKDPKIKAFDLQTAGLLQTVDYLEDHVPFETYRVRGNALHVIYRSDQFEPTHLNEALTEEGIEGIQINPGKVEMEDLLYLHLKQLSAPFDEKTNFRLEWIWPKEGIGDSEVVKADQIQKHFGSVEAVKKSSFTIHSGEIFGLIGSNGAGKTTTLKMLGGLLKPDRGTVRLLGQDPVLREEGALLQVGYMSQNFSLYQDLTVLENIVFYGGIYSIPLSLLQKNIEWILQITDLEAQRHQKVHDLPTGWKQRLALGCTLVHDPRIIFLDEPTSGVDPVTRRYFWHWMSFLAHQGRTIIVTTHDMSEAEQCHRVLLLDKGSILALGKPEEICHGEGEDKLLVDLEGVPIKKTVTYFQKLRGVHSINPFGNHLHLSFDKSEWDLNKVTHLLEHEGIPFQNLKTIPYSIEDVFVERIRG